FTGSFIVNVGENFSHLLAGHIFIDGHEKSPSGRTLSIIRDDTLLIDTLKEANIPVKYLTKRSSFQGSLIFEGESVTQNISGADWEKESYLRERLNLKEGSFEAMKNPNAIILSDEMAKKLNVHIGDSMLVQLTTVTGQQNIGDFVLAAVSFDPGIFGSISAYANIEHVNKLLNIEPHEYMTLGIFLPDIKLIDAEAEKYYKALENKVSLFERKAATDTESTFMSMINQVKEEDWNGLRYRLYTLNDMLSQVKQIVGILNTVGLVILLILLVIIMVGIMNTFRMIMYERIREIGTMRALGMQRRGVQNLFLLEALFLSIGGVIVGFIIAGIIMFFLSLINWGLNTPLFILLKNGHMTFTFIPTQIISNILLIALLTLLAALFPARKAARLEPADALRSYH
ncbi:MAG: FtsX-like permease family protein, partial [Spirochaetota bacterium]